MEFIPRGRGPAARPISLPSASSRSFLRPSRLLSPPTGPPPHPHACAHAPTSQSGSRSPCVKRACPTSHSVAEWSSSHAATRAPRSADSSAMRDACGRRSSSQIWGEHRKQDLNRATVISSDQMRSYQIRSVHMRSDEIRSGLM